MAREAQIMTAEQAANDPLVLAFGRLQGAAKRVGELEDELRLAAGLTSLRARAGMSQRDLAEQMGVSQPASLRSKSLGM